jgi:hypothetical protein
MLRIKNNMTDNFIGELFLEIQGRKKRQALFAILTY